MQQQQRADEARREAEALQTQELQRQQRARRVDVKARVAGRKDPHAELQAAIRKQTAARVALAKANFEWRLMQEERLGLEQRGDRAREALRRILAEEAADHG